MILDIFKIEGAHRLKGDLEMHGAKNSALPILAATVMLKGTAKIHNCPILSDVFAAMDILKALGLRVQYQNHSVLVDATTLSGYEIPEHLMLKMRSSVIFLGAILGRMGKAILSSPGGCEIGLRPIDLHVKAMQQMGAKIEEEGGKLFVTAPNGLHGANITLAFPSVGATENILLAASTAKGQTVLTNAAREPEISDLAAFLNAAGAKIQTIGDSTLVIDGVDALHSAEHIVIPDRMEAASYLLAGAMTKGEITVENMVPEHLSALLPVLKEAGCKMKVYSTAIHLKAPERLKAVKLTRTMPYPGFPTDAQAPLSAMLTVANGTSVVIENIFESRYKHALPLTRFGANIRIEGRMEVIEGVKQLRAAKVCAPDLRGGMALLMAGLAAEGETILSGLSHLDRGYEEPEIMLSHLGANIKRIKNYARINESSAKDTT